MAFDDELQSKKSALVALPGAVHGSGAGVVTGNVKQRDHTLLKVLAGADPAFGPQFGGAGLLGKTGDGPNRVPGLHGVDVEKTGGGPLRGARIAACASARSVETFTVKEAEVGDAVVIEIKLDGRAVHCNGNVRWGVNDFCFGRLRQGKQSNPSRASRDGIAHQAFVQVG